MLPCPRFLLAALTGLLAALVPRASRADGTLPAPVEIASGWQMQDVAKVTPSGGEVSQARFAATGWYRAVVPGTVMSTLVANGVYPDPLYGENNRPDKIPESSFHRGLVRAQRGLSTAGNRRGVAQGPGRARTRGSINRARRPGTASTPAGLTGDAARRPTTISASRSRPRSAASRSRRSNRFSPRRAVRIKRW